jgi:hypothetical protein
LLSVLREAHRLLESGGNLYLTVPSERFDQYTWISQGLVLFQMHKLQKLFRGSFNKFWKHYNFYNPAQWAAIVESNGFEILELRTYGPKRVCLMDDALAPLGLPAWITKRLLNRWSLLPGLRRILLAPVIATGEAILRGAERCEEGGLVFLAARKR